MIGTTVQKQSVMVNTINGSHIRRGWDLGSLAAQYSVSVVFLRKLIREGKLKATRLGRRVIVLHEDWEECLKSENEN